ncbi:MAG: FHA domain-containing protein [Deltaproteobacteria bacterium]|nr:FHA domain-containing protein [Deltaproteobacteria bacterium]
MFDIILKLNNNIVQEYSFDKDLVTIGRRDDNDIQIDNQAVSSHHAKIVKEDDGFYVYDLNSLNGTFVNNRRVSTLRMVNNAEVTIGKHVLVYKSLVDYGDVPEEIDDAVLADSFHDTMILDTKQQRELLGRQKQAALVPSVATLTGEKRIKGLLTIISGDNRQEFPLIKKMTVIGKSGQADIKIGGMFVGGTAAVISSRGKGYFISHSEGMSKPKVNGKTISDMVKLSDGDLIKIGSAQIQYNETIES